MDADSIVERLLDSETPTELLQSPLADDVAACVVERLKQTADGYWHVNINRSLELANMIVQIGTARRDSGQVALGMMARGDALKLLGRPLEAWEALGEAGELFERADDAFGWARSRIGRLAICTDLNRAPGALRDARRAGAIFETRCDHDKLVRLNLNTAVVYDLLGNQRQALMLYGAARTSALSLGEAGDAYLGPLATNMGHALSLLGEVQRAVDSFEEARRVFGRRGETSALATAEHHLARIHMAQAHYRQALELLHRIYSFKVTNRLLVDAAHIKRSIVECYLHLNRYAEACTLAQEVREAFHAFDATYEEASTLLQLATAEAELARFEEAQEHLRVAEQIFSVLDAPAWQAMVQLRRGQIALQQGDIDAAQAHAVAAETGFEAQGQQINQAATTLLRGQTLLAQRRIEEAAQAGAASLQIAKLCHLPSLRYSTHLLLGNVAEVRAQPSRAARHYHAAAATIERVERGLTITLRPGFLENKGEALRALLALYLRTGHDRRALTALERSKSHVLFDYLANREQLRWASSDGGSQALIEELDRLRGEHQWFYQLAHGQGSDGGGQEPACAPEHAHAEVARREQRMRAISEQLYLRSGQESIGPLAPTAAVSDIQNSLDEHTLLIEYYNDGSNLWAFGMDAGSLTVHALGAARIVDKLSAQLQLNVRAALNAGLDSPVLPTITRHGQRLLQRLYGALIEPLGERLHDRHRLVIVPYGSLHYLPFHLLHDGSSYLIELFEVVILPTASLATRCGPRRDAGAVILAHSWNGRLPGTVQEAAAVQRLVGGTVYYDEAASRTVLHAPPQQILHIAAHGEHRLDQPELSYIHLADGQLYSDDLLQHDLGYELVTLSGCETGRAHIAPADELIGLGRGFLYGGAGALVVSLWQTDDQATRPLMERMYAALLAGDSKAAALRGAQRALLAAAPELHPAIWGAFQLVGDPRPLSHSLHIVTKEQADDGIRSGPTTVG
ncbi:MAG: CHAT domain-containing protein [Herpetosiphon sp.]